MTLTPRERKQWDKLNALEYEIAHLTGLFPVCEATLDDFLESFAGVDDPRPPAEAWGAVYSIMRAMKEAVAAVNVAFHERPNEPDLAQK